MKKERVLYQVERKLGAGEWLPTLRPLDYDLSQARFNIDCEQPRSPGAKFRIAKYGRVGVAK